MDPQTDAQPKESTHQSRPAAVALMQRIEATEALDRLSDVVGAASAPVGGKAADYWLRGGPAGHALHPPLTDLPIGFWTSTLVLDGLELLTGRSRGTQRAADLLLGLGIASALPTAVTGLSEWRRLGPRDARVGSLHATLNAGALVLNVLSTVARRRGARTTGIALSVAAATATSAGGYLGGHLAAVRHAASRHPAFTEGDPA